MIDGFVVREMGRRCIYDRDNLAKAKLLIEGELKKRKL